MKGYRLLCAIFTILLFTAMMQDRAAGSDLDEFKIKREQVYEFTQKPVVVAQGDRVTISFTSKAYCDATVAIENADGDIIRHLASGVLGPNAPQPFTKNSNAQQIVWDGKDDQGRYVDDKNTCTVRVSLGLKARFEKSLFWEPKKRVSSGGAGAAWTEDVFVAPRPEGVYVYDGNGVDHLRLFDHDGNYVRTIYPFPADKLESIKGLKWHDYPQGYSRPQKNGLNRNSFLTSGGVNTKKFQLPAASALAVHDDKIALIKLRINRLKTDGSTGTFDLSGPKTWFDIAPERPWDGNLHKEQRACPYSAAFSPDGKRLYLAGYSCYTRALGRGYKHWLDGVGVVDYAGEGDAKIFTGTMQREAGVTPGVACDAAGNVYVSDYINNKIDIYKSDGKKIKTLPVQKPVFLSIDPNSSEIYVFSWYLGGKIWRTSKILKEQTKDLKGPEKRVEKFPATLTILKSMEDPSIVASYPIPWVVRNASWTDTTAGTDVRATVDFHTSPATIWLTPLGPRSFRAWGEGKNPFFEFRSAWDRAGMLLLQVQGNKLVIKRSFGKDTEASVKRVRSNNGHQRLYVNPANKKLYVTENEYWVGGGNFHNLLEIDPASGSAREIPIPIKWAEDLAFDIQGRIYLRQVNPQRIIRYDLNTWREIPWDYGEEGDDKEAKILSALPLPAWSTVCYSEGGLWVSPKGHLAVSCSTKDLSGAMANLRRVGSVVPQGKPYQPPVYPGRCMNPLTACVHIWDKHGEVITKDAVPGMSQVDGLCIDNEDNVYVMSTGTRILDDKKYFNFISGTIMKMKAGKNKWLSSSNKAAVPLQKHSQPDRAPDVYAYGQGNLWVEGAEWFYGGVGNCSFKIASGCICWQQSRFTLDYFSRSFAPENDQFSVAVLDKSGNLIMRIGKYGNVDDGMPLSKDKKSTSPAARSIGGDEVSLMHPSHVATMTDRHLYIGDVGNGRIVQVKLNYHAEAEVALQNVLNLPGP